ncbi:hypothetical protein ACFX11_012949 [Malus domestica]
MPTEGSPNLGLGFELIDLFSDFLLARLSLRVGILGGLPGLAVENSGEGELTGTDLENPLLDSAVLWRVSPLCFAWELNILSHWREILLLHCSLRFELPVQLHLR